MGFFDKLKKITTNLFSGFSEADEAFFEELEETLILADLGMDTALDAVEKLRTRVRKEKLQDQEAVKAAVGEVGSRIFAVNFDFLGLVDLARIPTLKFWTVAGGFALFLLPVVSAGSSLVFSFISMKTNAVNQQAAQAGNNASMKSMMITVSYTHLRAHET